MLPLRIPPLCYTVSGTGKVSNLRAVPLYGVLRASYEVSLLSGERRIEKVTNVT